MKQEGPGSEPERDINRASAGEGVPSKHPPLRVPRGRSLGPTTERLIREVQERNAAARRLTPEQLRRQLLTPVPRTRQRRTSAGRPLLYVACIFCGKSQYLFSPEKPPFGGDIEPLVYKVLQHRYVTGGPGRGNTVRGHGGFKVDPMASETIVQLLATHPAIVSSIRRRLLKIVKAYLEAGIIHRRDLEFG
jgi:hypothetical protein